MIVRRAVPLCTGLLLATACSSSAAVPPSARTASGGGRHSVVASTTSKLHVRAVATLANGVSRTVAVRTGQRLLILGGLAAGDVTTSRVVSIDPAAGRSHVVGALGEAVHDAAGALVGGVPLVFGGGASTEVADVQAWQRGQSHVVGRLPSGRSDSAAAVVAGTAYVVGGFDGSSLVRDIEATTDGRHFRVAGRLRVGARYPAVVAYRGAVWVFGGEQATTDGTSGGPETSAIQRFDPSSGRTTIVGHLPKQMGHAMAFTLGGSLYVAGGRSAGVARDQILRIDPATGHSTRVGRLPYAESDAGVVEGPSTVWLIGGETAGPTEPQRKVFAITLS